MGGSKLASRSSNLNKLAAEWAEEAAAEAEANQSNPWGSDDLMDVNADEDDWSEFFGYPLRERQLY